MNPATDSDLFPGERREIADERSDCDYQCSLFEVQASACFYWLITQAKSLCSKLILPY